MLKSWLIAKTPGEKMTGALLDKEEAHEALRVARLNLHEDQTPATLKAVEQAKANVADAEEMVEVAKAALKADEERRAEEELAKKKAEFAQLEAELGASDPREQELRLALVDAWKNVINVTANARSYRTQRERRIERLRRLAADLKRHHAPIRNHQLETFFPRAAVVQEFAYLPEHDPHHQAFTSIYYPLLRGGFAHD